MMPNKRPCRYFFGPSGKCNKGGSCEFSHDPSSQHSFSSGGGGPPFNTNRPGGHGFQSKDSHSNYNNNYQGGGRPGGPGGGGKPWKPRPDFQKKPKPNYQEQPHNLVGGMGGNNNSSGKGYPNSNPKGPRSFCKFFRQGTCGNSENCKFDHTWTDNDDLTLIYIRAFGDEKSKGDDFEIRDVSIVDIDNKIIAFAQPKGIIFVNLNAANNPTGDITMRSLTANEELTCMRFCDGNLLLGIYDELKKCSLVKIMQSNGNETSIDPAHQDYIVDICNLKTYCITASLDTKIKFWEWNNNTLKFEVICTHIHKEMSKMKNLTYNGVDSIFVANTDFSLTIYTLDYSTPTLTLKMLANYENYHYNIITSMKFHMINKKLHLITGGFDKTIKFFSMEEGKIMHQQSFEMEIASFDIVSNSKDKEILVVGFASGNVALYDMQGNFEEIGKLIIHKPRIVSNIVGFNELKNDVAFKYMVVTDTGGRLTIWQFQKGRK